jgi:hypothetical protein
VPSRAGHPGGRPLEPLAFSRRGFFARASTAALAAFSVVAGSPGLARAASPAGTEVGASASPDRPQPPPCKIRCEPVTKTGCACGGYLYRCRGCHSSFHACIDGRPFTWVCLRRTC